MSSYDGRMPKRGPTFVHDLRLTLWREVISLVADDGKHIHSPRLQRAF